MKTTVNLTDYKGQLESGTEIHLAAGRVQAFNSIFGNRKPPLGESIDPLNVTFAFVAYPGLGGDDGPAVRFRTSSGVEDTAPAKWFLVEAEVP